MIRIQSNGYGWDGTHWFARVGDGWGLASLADMDRIRDGR